MGMMFIAGYLNKLKKIKKSFADMKNGLIFATAKRTGFVT